MLYWVDVDQVNDHRFDTWYNHEHLPERLAIPGFVRGRRYLRAAGSGHKHLTVYDARDTAVFSSPEYLARLNDPTPLTREVVSALRDPHRVVLDVLFSQGAATGSELAVLHLPDHADGLPGWVAAELAPAVLEDTDACGLHLAVSDSDATAAKAVTAEGQDAAEAVDSGYVLLLDSIRRATEQAARIADICERQGYGGKPAELSVYKHLVTLCPGGVLADS
jgi:hypothetical protein